MKKKEASARIKINHLLEEAGWRFFDNENGPANIQLESNVKMSKADLTGLGENFDKVKNGFVDFLLLDDKGKPFIVLEAKAEDKDPLVGKEQAREYAKSLYLKYVILSNGNQHYFWNIYKGNPQLITVFPSYGSIRESKAMNADPAKLYSEEIGADYIAVIKNPRYMEAPEYINPETRQQFLYDNGLRFLRQYQINALKALQESVRHGNQRFLFEMATGTGKTLTSAAVIRLFLRSGNANRVLFLVDRIELENQAMYFDADGNPKALSKGQYGIKRSGKVNYLLDKNGNSMLCVDNLLNGFPCMVVVFGCVVCLLMIVLPKSLSVVLTIVYVAFILYETLMLRESGDARTNLVLFSYAGKFLKEQSVRVGVINNIWLFIPLGTGLYRWFQKKWVLQIPFVMSMAIETTQYITGLGIAEFDDVFGNTMGGWIGVLVAWTWLSRKMSVKNRA